jgi:hypothetical protein
VKTDLLDCFHKADNDKFAIDAAVNTVNRAMGEANAAGQALADDFGQVQAIAAEAQGQIGREATLDRIPPHLHYWLDTDIATYQSHMKNLRRLTYLAVRTFEYEGQVTSDQRSAVLTARTPTDLLDVLNKLDAESAAFAGQLPKAGSPGQNPDVFSVRDDILDLKGLITSQSPPGQPPPLSPAQAFTRLLTSDGAKLYDGHGNLLGHAIRFSLAGNSAWNQGTCAERIWRITPSVQTDGHFPTGPNGTHLVLFQQNTFGSQVCTDPTNPDVPPGATQFVSYQPITDLLTGDDPVTFSSPAGFTSANIDYVPDLNATELRTVQQGDNPGGFDAEFAGRGMIGNYILFFPVCSPPACTNDTQGWTDANLSHVSDVLLRFDVVSASNNPQPQSIVADHPAN